MAFALIKVKIIYFTIVSDFISIQFYINAYLFYNTKIQEVHKTSKLL